jgi:large subunit ribosomal protein L30
LSSKKRKEAAASSRPQAGAAATRLRITLLRSLIGLKPTHVRTLQALGLRKIRATVEHDDTPSIRGMVARVPYAVRVEEEKSA